MTQSWLAADSLGGGACSKFPGSAGLTVRNVRCICTCSIRPRQSSAALSMSFDSCDISIGWRNPDWQLILWGHLTLHFSWRLLYTSTRYSTLLFQYMSRSFLRNCSKANFVKTLVMLYSEEASIIGTRLSAFLGEFNQGLQTKLHFKLDGNSKKSKGNSTLIRWLT